MMESRHRVVSFATPRIAAQDTPHGQCESLERSVLHDGLTGILRASGCETARRGCVGGDEMLIKENR